MATYPLYSGYKYGWHLVNRCCRRGAKVVIDYAQTRPRIPSGPGVTSRDAILFVASRSSSCVTCSSSLHSVVVVSSKGEGVVLSASRRCLAVGTESRRLWRATPDPCLRSGWGAESRSFYVTSR